MQMITMNSLYCIFFNSKFIKTSLVLLHYYEWFVIKKSCEKILFVQETFKNALIIELEVSNFCDD